MKFVLLLSVLITGCSGCNDCGIDRDWYYEYQQFFIKAKRAGINFFPGEPMLCKVEEVTSFDDSDRIGQCGIQYFEEGAPWISDIQVIDQKNERDNRFLLYHELTHCIFGLDHVDDPDQIMYFQLPAATRPEWQYERDLFNFIKEKYREGNP